MNGLQALEELKTAIRAQVRTGTTTLSPNGVIEYLELLKDELREPDAMTELERKKALAAIGLESMKMHHNAGINTQTLQHTSDLEAFRATIQAGSTARKDLLLINAGACVALLALLGHFVSSNSITKIAAFVPALKTFATGAALCVLASGLTYLCQWLFEREHIRHLLKAAWVAQVAAIGTWLASAAFFVYGAYASADAFMSMTP